MDDLNRRDFLKIGSAALAAVNIEASPAARPQESGPFAAPVIETVRIGFVGHRRPGRRTRPEPPPNPRLAESRPSATSPPTHRLGDTADH